MKGQINLEFLATAALFIFALGSILLSASTLLPTYTQGADRTSLHLESRSITNQLLSTSGRHTSGGGGTEWESNTNTINNTVELGLTDNTNSFLEVERDKVMALDTNGPGLTYIDFKDITDAKNQYLFNFTWMPTVDTTKSFQRGSPPPKITEPGNNNFLPYNVTDNKVHYGTILINGRDYRFLVTARDGVYNATYVSDNWDFSASSPLDEGSIFNVYGTNYQIEQISNREKDPGSLVILEKHLKEFGANIDSDSIVIKSNRYAVMENEPLRIEVWTW